MTDKPTAPPAPPDATASFAGPPLFRNEVLERRSVQWLGPIKLAQPASAVAMTAIAAAISIALIALVTLGSVNKKARVTGVTVPVNGAVTILAPSAGVLTRLLVSEGDRVKTGDPLFELATDREGTEGQVSVLVAQQLSVRLDTLIAERRSRIAQDGEKQRGIESRLRNLAVESAQLEQELAFARRRLELGRESVRKFETLFKSGYVSEAQLQQKQEEAIDLGTRLSALERSKAQLQDTQLALEAERRALSSELRSVLSQLDRAEASVRQELIENKGRQTLLVTAKQPGIVTAISNSMGQSINTGQVLATLLPNGNEDGGHALEAHLYAPSRTAGFIAPGQKVLLRYQAFPYQKFGLQEGTVVNVSMTPFAPAELPANIASTILSTAQSSLTGFNTNEGLYRIKVTLAAQSINAYGKSQPLKPGMTLEADVLQERRQIWEWILDPVLAIARR